MEHRFEMKNVKAIYKWNLYCSGAYRFEQIARNEKNLAECKAATDQWAHHRNIAHPEDKHGNHKHGTESLKRDFENISEEFEKNPEVAAALI